MLDKATSYNRFGDRCRYHLNAAPDLSLFSDEQFDFIISLITLQHIEARYTTGYLREFMRVLAPGGVLVFQLPSERTAHFRLKCAVKKLLPKGLLYRYRRSRYGAAFAAEPTQHDGMEMYGMPVAEVTSVLSECGGRVVEADRDNHAGNWVSCRYFVSKP